VIRDEQVRTFWADGAICLRGLFDQKWIERMRGAVEQALDAPGPIGFDVGKTDPKAKQTNRFYVELSAWTRLPDFAAFVYESPAVDIAARLLGSRKVNLFFDQLFIKEPGTPESTPWHQDRPYWPVDGDQILSVWVPFDPVTLENGGLEYVRGSHRWPHFYRPGGWGDNPQLDAVMKQLEGEEPPDIDAKRDEHELLSWDMEPGDCLVHHAMTVHGAPGNRTAATRRRAYATRWTGDDVTWNPRPGILEIIPPPTLKEIPLKKGDPLDCEAFPRLWPR
jgi:ectoine hydroxylase-related dioxygenase (phytanoyl-CoA dioxygenase family)